MPHPFRHPLARELTAVLTVKICLITLAAIFVFGPASRPHVDPAVMAHHLLAENRPPAS